MQLISYVTALIMTFFCGTAPVCGKKECCKEKSCLSCVKDKCKC
jgi:hypothetical protein